MSPFGHLPFLFVWESFQCCKARIYCCNLLGMLFVKVVILSLQKSNSEFPPLHSNIFHTLYEDETENYHEHLQYKRFHNKYRSSRGIVVPEKIKDSLLKLEQLMFSHLPTKLIGTDQDFSVITITLTQNMGIHKIKVHKNLAPPNKPPPIFHIEISNLFTVAAAKTIPQIFLIQPKKLTFPILEIKKSNDLQITIESTPDIINHLSLNTTNELLLVSFKTGFKIYAIGAEKGLIKISQNPIGSFQSQAPKLRCFFSKVFAYKIISMEEIDHQVKVIMWEYSIDKHQLIKGKVSLLNIQPEITCLEPNRDDSKLLFGCSDGTLALYDVEKSSETITLIRWHISNCMIVVCTATSVYFVDVMLKEFKLEFELDQKDSCINILKYLNYHAKITQACWLVNTSEKAEENPGYDDFIVLFDRGPIVLIRVELGSITKGSFTPIDLFMEYLSNNELNKAVLQMQSMKRLDDLYLAFSFILNHLLIQENEDAETFMYGLLVRYQETFLESPKYKKQYENFATRYFQKILRAGKLEDAFKFAQAFNSASYFQDIATWSKHLGEFVIADVARTRAIELDPNHNNPEWDKSVIGVDAIEDYFNSLEEAEETGAETLSTEDVVRLGLWYEAHGNYNKALEVYEKYYMQSEHTRLQQLLTLLPKERSV